MVREISKKRYIAVFLITILVFFLGLLLGMALEESKISIIQSINEEQKMDFTSLQLQYNYLNYLKDKDESCNAIQETLQNNLLELDKSLQRVISLRDQNSLATDEYRAIERQYLLDNLKYWFFVQQAKETCDLDVVTILYFFNEKECEECGELGAVLSYYKKILEERLLVFPLDTELLEDEPILRILFAEYSVDYLPTIVLSGKTYEGKLTQEETLDIICPLYNSKPEICNI